MVEERVVDLTSELEMECLWFCFSWLLQKILDEVKEHWNTHRIRGSRHDTMRGRPDSLYYLPELHGATDQFLLPISEAERNYACSHVVESDSGNDYQEYFQYVSEICGLGQCNDWREALELYNTLLQVAYNGSTWVNISNECFLDSNCLQCVASDSVHTPPTEGMGNFWVGGGILNTKTLSAWSLIWIARGVWVSWKKSLM